MNPSRKRLFFHVGTVKTGSTFIQKFLFDNRRLLHDIDVDYILMSPPRLDLPRYANADFILEHAFDEGVARAEIKQSRCKNILISEEGLAARPDVLTHAAFDSFDRTVILYIRAPVDLIASWAGETSLPYNFWQKKHASMDGITSVERRIPKLQFEYHATLTNLLNALDARPDIRLCIRPYMRDRFVNGGIIDDFFAALGISVSDAMRAAVEGARFTVVNEGKTRKYCDIAAAVAEEVERCGAVDQYTYNLVDYVYAACRSGDDRRVIDTLSDEEMQRICAGLMPIYDRLRSRGLDFHAFDRAMLPMNFGSNRAPYQGVDADEVRSLVADYFSKISTQ